MRQSRYHSNPAKYIKIIFVLALAASGFFIYSLYTDNEQKAASIVIQSQNIADLETTVDEKNLMISDQVLEISSLNSQVGSLVAQVVDLQSRLGIAEEEIGELKPKITNYFVVGVRGDGKGVVVPVQVKIIKGNGAISANINNVEFKSGTQNSIRTAAAVASIYSKVPISDKDITVSFMNEGEDIVTVDGGSAGGAITAATIVTLLDREINTGILMTGTIAIQQNIGPVGSVSAKAEAARDAGAHTFLVPKGLGVAVSGISVVEVANIDEVVGRILI